MTEKRPKPEQEKGTGRFVAGNSGNGGRPKGARNKLGEAFLQDMLKDWQENGAQAIVQVREEKPDAYLKVVASILPQQHKVQFEPFEDMTDDQLRQRAEQLLEQLGPVAALAAGGDLRRAEDEARTKPLN